MGVCVGVVYSRLDSVQQNYFPSVIKLSLTGMNSEFLEYPSTDLEK